MSCIQGIRLRDLRVGYDDHEVVHSITCTLRHGRTTVIVGPGGSGKSSLLHAMARSTRAHRGGLWLAGDIDGTPDHVAILRQHIAASEETLIGRLRRWPHCNGDPERWVGSFWRAAAAQAGDVLTPLLHTPLNALPRALRRLAEFTVVASSPAPVLLIDEPDMGVGDRVRGWMTRKLAAMRGQRTVVLVTHHLGLARQASDDVIFLLDGRIVEVGSTADMFSRPRHPRTQALLTYGS